MQGAAFKDAFDLRMSFELLEALVRIESRIVIIQTDDESDGDAAFGHAVNESAAELLVPQRPAHSMDHAAAHTPLLGHIPNFLHAHGKHLRISFSVQIELADQLFCQRSASAFGENRYLGADVDARFKGAFRLAVLVDAFIPRPDPGYGVALDQQIGACEACEDIDAALLHLSATRS